MIEALFVFAILLVVAWAAWQFLPHPIGVVIASIVALLALWVLVAAIAPDLSVDRD